MGITEEAQQIEKAAAGIGSVIDGAKGLGNRFLDAVSGGADDVAKSMPSSPSSGGAGKSMDGGTPENVPVSDEPVKSAPTTPGSSPPPSSPSGPEGYAEDALSIEDIRGGGGPTAKSMPRGPSGSGSSVVDDASNSFAGGESAKSMPLKDDGRSYADVINDYKREIGIAGAAGAGVGVGVAGAGRAGEKEAGVRGQFGLDSDTYEPEDSRQSENRFNRSLAQ